MLGLTPGADVVFRPAVKDILSATPIVDVWDGPDARYPGFLPFGVAEPIEIVSDAAADTAAGVGARQLFVQGLDANYAIQTKIYTLNGTTPVTTPEVWTRLWQMSAISAGDKHAINVGTITAASQHTGTPTMALMRPGFGSTQSSNFTIPAGHVGVAFSATVGTNNLKIAEVSLRGSVLSEADDFPFILGVGLASDAGANNVPILFRVPALTDIIVEGVQVSGNTRLLMSYSIYITTLAAIGDPTTSPLFGVITP